LELQRDRTQAEARLVEGCDVVPYPISLDLKRFQQSLEHAAPIGPL
jgi:hypothetical protein